jgi:hypothetical protein
MVKIENFLSNIKSNCSDVTYLSVKHILEKDIKLDEDNIEQFFANYQNYHIYLNDFAGTIYNRYGSSVNNIYIEMCKFLNIDIDNSYTLEHTIKKLERQTPQLLLSLTNEDMQKQAIDNFYEKLDAIESSVYYKNNIDKFINRIDNLKSNIALVKNALNQY